MLFGRSPVGSRLKKMKYALVGSPVDHSLSPQLHRAFAECAGLHHFDYEKLELSAEDAKAGMERLFQQGYVGLNVTAPLKRIAFDWVDELSPEAEQLGGVNTVIWNDEGLAIGHNSDGVGFAALCGERNPKRVVVFGSGGVLPTLITTLIRLGVEKISVVSRRRPSFKPYQQDLIELGWLDFLEDTYQALHGCDTVINALPRSASLSLVERVASDLPRGIYWIDLNYGQSMAPTFAHLSSRNVSYCDGLGMLVYQGADSFRWFTGHLLPASDVSAVLQDLRERLSRSN